MATTVPAPVGNTIALAERYLPILDEIYKAGSKSAILDTAAERVRWDGAKKAYLFNTTLVGLSNYDRNAGFVPGDATDGWEDYEITQDRGRSFLIDAMDNDETLGMAFGTLVGEFERTKVIPEMDAYRFAKYASGAAVGNVKTETLSAGAATIASIDGATEALDNAEVPYEGRILFVSPSTYRLIKSGITRMVMNRDRDVDYNVEMYNDMRVITVPQPRFSTAITLANPTTSSGAGGYTASGDNINYMIIHPSAVLQVMQHYAPRVFSPEQNIEADAWRVQPRYCHGAWVKTHKTNGIYVSHA